MLNKKKGRILSTSPEAINAPTTGAQANVAAIKPAPFTDQQHVPAHESKGSESLSPTSRLTSSLAMDRWLTLAAGIKQPDAPGLKLKIPCPSDCEYSFLINP